MIDKASAIHLLSRTPDDSMGSRGYGAAMGLVAGAGWAAWDYKDRVSGFLSDVSDKIETAIKVLLFLCAAILVVVVLK